MKNRVRVRAPFSFRGRTYQPELVLDLDRFLTEERTPSEIYPLLAAANGIDPYSYEYEVLEVTPLEFDRPEGLARAYLEEGRLDLEGLREALLRERRRQKLLEIARRHLRFESPETVPGLLEALEEAWQAGARNDSPS